MMKTDGMFPDPPHVFPLGDFFKHDKDIFCPCNPYMDYEAISALRMGVHYWHHNLVQKEPIPDEMPDSWTYTDNDPED